MSDLPLIAQTRRGDRVTMIEAHKGLIKGQIKIGIDQRGEPIMKPRFWYADGRMTPAGESAHDLILIAIDDGPEVASPGILASLKERTRTSASRIAARTHADLIEFDYDQTLDDWLDDGLF